ncbi:uncharacterized protein LOC110191332 [Drosophila serrata]|uniref:uncharacterized protein LOC110191332 n=1 Tax=Drosophila serrata TaxID=7274 RepID=UPI000A1D3117|nr:uncharacterized protein LOC110191332 [Drosophila serrata]
MAWTTGRILLQLYSHRVQRQSFASTTPDGASGQKLDGLPTTAKGSFMESLFSKWLQDHRSIHGTWNRFFKDFVEDKAAASDDSSTKTDSESNQGSEILGQGDTLPPQPTLDSILPGSVIQLPEKITQQETPEEPDKAAKGDEKPTIRKRRRFPKFTLFHKFAKFRRRGVQETKKGRSVLFKSYYEDKLNKEKAKQSKRKQDGLKDNPKKELLEKSQEKLQPIHLGDEFHDPNESPKTSTYKSLDAIIDELDNATINMALPHPIHKEGVKEIQLWKADGALQLCKMPSDIKSFTDLPRTLIDHSEKSSKSEEIVLMSEDKATDNVSTAEVTAEAKSENLTEGLQAPLDDVIDKKHETDAPTQPPIDP